MKKIIYISFMLLTVAMGCSDNKNKNVSTQEKADTTAATTVATPAASPIDSTQLPAGAKSFILPDHEVLKFQKGDLNKDNIEDIVLILENKQNDGDAPRPLLLLLQDAKGTFTLAAKNDKVVACKDCGGMMGDPLAGIAIKNGFFTIEEEGGSRENGRDSLLFNMMHRKKRMFCTA